jgi:hypothetical protein
MTAVADRKQQRGRVTHTYTNPKEQPTEAEIERRTTCQCERPNVVRDLDSAPGALGHQTYKRVCMKCGKNARKGT